MSEIVLCAPGSRSIHVLRPHNDQSVSVPPAGVTERAAGAASSASLLVEEFTLRRSDSTTAGVSSTAADAAWQATPDMVPLASHALSVGDGLIVERVLCAEFLAAAAGALPRLHCCCALRGRSGAPVHVVLGVIAPHEWGWRQLVAVALDGHPGPQDRAPAFAVSTGGVPVLWLPDGDRVSGTWKGFCLFSVIY